MKTYKLVLTADVKKDLRRYLGYIRRKYKNNQAIKSVRDDFYETAVSLKENADSIKEPDSDGLRKRKLKRINFIKSISISCFSEQTTLRLKLCRCFISLKILKTS